MNLQSLFTDSKKQNLLILSCLLFSVAIPMDGFARAIQTVSLALLGIYFLWNFNFQKLKSISKDQFFIILISLFLIQVLSGFYTSDLLAWQRKVLLKLPLLLVPLFLFQSEIRFRTLILMLQAFSISVSVIGLLSVQNYLINHSEINKLILQSKPIPIVGGTMHIYFSLMLAVSIFFCGYLWRYFKQNQKTSGQIFWALCFTANFVSLHLLAARTGLLAFYLTLFIVVLVFGIRARKYLLTIGLLFTGFVISTLLVSFLPSLHNRFENTLDDLNRYRHGEYIGYFSISARFETWKASTDLIKEKPLIGQGLGGVENGLLKQYDINQSRLMGDDKLRSCHNQYLETAVATGLPSLLLLVCLIITSLTGVDDKVKFLNLAFILIIASAFLVESLLERQAGISLFILFASVFRNLRSEIND